MTGKFIETYEGVQMFNTVAEYEAWRAGNRFYVLLDEMRQAREPANEADDEGLLT